MENEGRGRGRGPRSGTSDEAGRERGSPAQPGKHTLTEQLDADKPRSAPLFEGGAQWETIEDLEGQLGDGEGVDPRIAAHVSRATGQDVSGARVHRNPIAGATLLALATLVVAATHRRRELFELRHMRDLDDVCAAVLADPAHALRDTALGVAASCHELPDGRLDWVWSSSHPAWSIAVATRLADALCPAAEIFPGRTPGVVHIVIASGTTGRRTALGSRVPIELVHTDRADSRPGVQPVR